MKTDLTIIGGGPAGYAAAVRGAKLGGEVILIEEKKLGGVCVNTGCIPSKTLLYSTGLLNQIRAAEELGVKIGRPTLDLTLLMKRKKAVTENVASEIEHQLKKHNIKIHYGHGRLTTPRTVEIN